jgi:hypothetical protein
MNDRQSQEDGGEKQDACTAQTGRRDACTTTPGRRDACSTTPSRQDACSTMRDAGVPQEAHAIQENPPERVDRRQVLNAERRRKILAVVANGSSLRSAARYVGCSHSTILRAVARDPEFAEQMGHALQNVEIEALYNIRKAARKERHWRAAAWLLERTNTDDYGQRRPRTYTAPEVAAAASQFIHLMPEVIPEEHVDYALARLDAIIDYLGREGELPKAGHLPTPGVVLDKEPDEEPWWMHLNEALARGECKDPPEWAKFHTPPDREEFSEEELAEFDEPRTDDVGAADCGDTHETGLPAKDEGEPDDVH